MRNIGLPLREIIIIYGDHTLEHGYNTTLGILEEKRKFSTESTYRDYHTLFRD